MGSTKKIAFLSAFLINNKHYPIIYALGAGLYPTIFYFTNNYTLINTWSHVAYFSFVFISIPIVCFTLAHYVSKLSLFSSVRKYVLPFLNVFTFLFLLEVCLYADVQVFISLAILVIAVLFALFFFSFLKKLVVIQFLLVLIGMFSLIPTVIKQINYSTEWQKQPDDILQVDFKKTPNVYLIQPDGYANFSELNKEPYNLDFSEFASYLNDNNFKYYYNFRSNYASTLSSNSATFMMKHHHYNKGTSFSEAVNARNVIVSKNAMLDIFKNNNYKTHLITELPYLLMNRPEIGFDYSNFTLEDVSFIGTGLKERQEIIEPLRQSIETDTARSKFFFIEIFNPGHINTRKEQTLGVEGERLLWAESMERANAIIYKAVDLIKEKDPNALIIILADHGGGVGLEYTNQTYSRIEDEAVIYSLFSSTLAIHWPNGIAPHFDDLFKSNVNVFRILFAYLGEEEKYLDNLQENGSYIVINKKAPKGIYQYINDSGKVTFKKV
jgi:hypothetical protein